jgi:hypothetical protein
MDITRRDNQSIQDFAEIMNALKNRVDDHGTPVTSRGDHNELGWVILVKEGHSAVLISEHPFVNFIAAM